MLSGEFSASLLHPERRSGSLDSRGKGGTNLDDTDTLLK